MTIEEVDFLKKMTNKFSRTDEEESSILLQEQEVQYQTLGP